MTICSIEGCDNPTEGRTILCASHNYEQRKEAKMARRIKVVRAPKKVSEQKAEELKEYTKLRKQFLEFKMVCELAFPGCTTSATTIHHNSMSEKNFLNIDTWTAACFKCHRKLETEISAEERRMKGLLTD